MKFGFVAGIMGVIQAGETIKLIIAEGNILTGRLIVYDALRTELKHFSIKKSKNCLVCKSINSPK